MSLTRGKAVLIATAAILSLTTATALSSYAIVGAGHVGVVTHFGAVQDEVLPEGLHMIMPFRTEVVPIDVQIQKVEARASASSKDLQVVSSVVALNFMPSAKKANVIYRELGKNYRQTIIEPTIQESVKSATARYTAEELITRRPEVKKAIYEDIKARLVRHNLVVTDFSIVDFNFSGEFNRAIESKQVAEQSALRARHDLVRIKTEAEQERERARGKAEARLALARAEAEAQVLLRESLTPELLSLRATEKWDGTLPGVMCNPEAGAFFDVMSAQGKKVAVARKH